MKVLKVFQLTAALVFVVSLCSAKIPEHDEIGSIMNAEPLIKAFVSKVPHVPSAAILKLETDVLKESASDEAKVARSSGHCIIDWAAPCPAQWSKTTLQHTGNIMCLAPADYHGLCKTEVSFQTFTAPSKQEWAVSCGVKWPCEGEICADGRDFNQMCPDYFFPTDSGHCQPDVSQYNGVCSGTVDFTSFSDDAKEQWSVACGAYWPCKQQCKGACTSSCPTNWQNTGDGDCLAPLHRKHPENCSRKQNFRYYTEKMKAQFEKICNAPFECEECHKDYDRDCPEGWEESNGSCNAKPGSLNLSCSMKSFRSRGLSTNDKMAIERTCQIDWPTMQLDVCMRDWLGKCPEHWELVKLASLGSSEEVCVPAASYKGLCKEQRSFASFSNEQRRHWASNCHAPWPCTSSGGPARKTGVERRLVESEFTATVKATKKTKLLRDGAIQDSTGIIGNPRDTLKRRSKSGPRTEQKNQFLKSENRLTPMRKNEQYTREFDVSQETETAEKLRRRTPKTVGYSKAGYFLFGSSDEYY